MPLLCPETLAAEALLASQLRGKDGAKSLIQPRGAPEKEPSPTLLHTMVSGIPLILGLGTRL